MVAQEAATGALAGLEPAQVWRWFGELAEIPRPSRHESRVVDWLKDFASQRSLEIKGDSYGNQVIYRPGSGGGEGAPTIVLQGHIDMVTEKNASSSHDFMNDPIRLQRHGDWLKADGTTLGADNGLGVAASLAILDLPADAALPPIEALFTVEEEIGLKGAFALDGSLLKGRIMLNLDTEEAGQIYIGCAGGGDSEILLPVEMESAPTGAVELQVTVDGLKGGHSGVNIHECRGNANQLLTRSLRALLGTVEGARVASMQGGDKRNALAREASAVVLVPSEGVQAAQQAVADQLANFKQEYGLFEGGLSVRAERVDGAPGGGPSQVLTASAVDRLLGVLAALPHGVVKMSHAVEGLVETSNNLASIKPVPEDKTYSIVLTTRSSITPALQAQRDRIAAVAKLGGGKCIQNDFYPGWAPNPESKVVKLAEEVFTELLPDKPQLLAIHAGLECGIIGERIPGIDMVSYGPTITGAHSPDEQVQISTVEPFWKCTKEILHRLAAAKA
eukprot:CAMPEP_0206143220 /NCGR_PEP_ID=MMETSP1473-20131121/19682_1 /ASSEMBLY_ACC=CAM_ASM_001109 /TAXON_ID=1461547 /ORGANISM="Stichococcus sp, Strain RCC1054" /LENGTH=503 /DNA_ID=CAMNT_0053538521 /DNA_START=190 /DNA_END=1701 /DNA_ORIENTATION=-